MTTNAKLTAKDDISRDYKSTHNQGDDWDNWTSTVSHLFTGKTTKLNQELGL